MSRCSDSGVIAALFGPIKYGILPDHLRREELVSGNALVEGATFAAIICGLVFGGFAAAEGRSAASVVAQLIARRARLLRFAALHPADRRRRAGAQGQQERLRLDLDRDPRSAAPTIASGSARSATSWFWIGRRGDAVAGPGHRQVAHRRRHRRRDCDQSRSSPIGIAAGSLAAAALLAWAHLAERRRPSCCSRWRRSRSTWGFRPARCRSASGEVRAHRILHERRRPAHRARDLRLFGRAPACSSCRFSPPFRPGRARTAARASSRAVNALNYDLHGRRFACDHWSCCKLFRPRASRWRWSPRRRQYRGGGLFLPPPAGEDLRILKTCARGASGGRADGKLVPFSAARRPRPVPTAPSPWTSARTWLASAAAVASAIGAYLGREIVGPGKEAGWIRARVIVFAPQCAPKRPRAAALSLPKGSNPSRAGCVANALLSILRGPLPSAKGS